MSYTPLQGSVAWKVIEYLTTHPLEELTNEQVSAKFDKPLKQIHSLLGAAVEHRVLVRGENEDGDIVYRLLKPLDGIKPNPAGAPTLHTAGLPSICPVVPKPRRHTGPRRAPQVIDVMTVQIDDGVPVPSCGPLRTDWARLFDRMKVGQSVVLPLSSRTSIAKASTDYHRAGKGKMSLRANAGELRVWRLS